mmetsp:Transcript_23590/g.33097  ORF Transcript_23590/g.33097 Transcript_23590/m.33097 type:complete len:311 (-) Transcript_23590:132-1064(-)
MNRIIARLQEQLVHTNHIPFKRRTNLTFMSATPCPAALSQEQFHPARQTSRLFHHHYHHHHDGDSYSFSGLRNCSKTTIRMYGTSRASSSSTTTKATTLPIAVESILNSNKRMPFHVNHPHDQYHYGNQYDNRIQRRYGSSNTTTTTPKSTKQEQGRSRRRRRRIFVPAKAPLTLTPQAREFFKRLTQNTQKHVLLDYQSSQTGEPRMVFTFTLLSQDDLLEDETYETTRHEGVVSLELVETNGTNDKDKNKTQPSIPKPPKDAIEDGLLKLYVGQNAFLKVLGCVIDINPKTGMPIVQDKYGNTMDPNA